MENNKWKRKYHNEINVTINTINLLRLDSEVVGDSCQVLSEKGIISYPLEALSIVFIIWKDYHLLYRFPFKTGIMSSFPFCLLNIGL